MNQLAEAYDEGLRAGELRLQYCEKCERAIMYPKHRCPHCFGSELTWRPAAGTGTLYSLTVQHLGAPTAFTDQLPYALGVVRLEEGVQLLGRLLPDADGGWSGYGFDMAVEFVPHPAGVPETKRPIAWFRPVAQ
jgi:uncharacterized OB-fold protein